MLDRESLTGDTLDALNRALDQSAAGDTEDLGDFTQYADRARESERGRMWDAIVAVRDASARAANDADTEDIIDALLAAGFGNKEAAWDEGVDAVLDDPTFGDYRLNPYRTTTNGAGA